MKKKKVEPNITGIRNKQILVNHSEYMNLQSQYSDANLGSRESDDRIFPLQIQNSTVKKKEVRKPGPRKKLIELTSQATEDYIPPEEFKDGGETEDENNEVQNSRFQDKSSTNLATMESVFQKQNTVVEIQGKNKKLAGLDSAF